MNTVNKNMRAKDDEQTLLTDTGNNVSDKEEAEVMTEEFKKEWLVPMTVRFMRETNEVFQDLADRHGVSKAQVVRLAAVGGLEKYFENLRYIDREQADVINKNIIIFGEQLAEIKEELRRIGVNYNQEIKLKQIEKKMKYLSGNGDIGMQLRNRDKIKKLEEEADGIRSNGSLLDKKEIEHLMTRFEEAAQKVSEALWHMQG